ncbi:hypothetical protein [Pseudomonas serbica]|uniref:hypothetical protein n=1 Tax=Pseudomonas serbica TaxID=2965074 RepID=UPI00237AC571|nr:hypothetical protein [Pseudomonas serbica]
MASTKMVVGLRIEVDFTEFHSGESALPWVNMKTLALDRFAQIIEDTVYQDSKIEIICPDDYLDVTILDPEVRQDSQLTAINEFARIFLEQSMKRRKGRVVVVSKLLEALTGECRSGLRAPPCWLFFIIKGSTDLTNGVWLSHFLLLMRVRQAVYDKTSRSPIGQWLPMFKMVAEDCLGLKLRDEVMVGRIL